MRKILALLCALSLGACANYGPNQSVGAGIGAVTGGLLCSLLGQGNGRLLAVGLCAVAGAATGASVGQTVDQLQSNRQLPQGSATVDSGYQVPQTFILPDECERQFGRNQGALESCRRGQAHLAQERQRALEDHGYNVGRGRSRY